MLRECLFLFRVCVQTIVKEGQRDGWSIEIETTGESRNRHLICMKTMKDVESALKVFNVYVMISLISSTSNLHNVVECDLVRLFANRGYLSEYLAPHLCSYLSLILHPFHQPHKRSPDSSYDTMPGLPCRQEHRSSVFLLFVEGQDNIY